MLCRMVMCKSFVGVEWYGWIVSCDKSCDKSCDTRMCPVLYVPCMFRACHVTYMTFVRMSVAVGGRITLCDISEL